MMSKFNLIRFLLLTSILTFSIDGFSKGHDVVKNSYTSNSLESSHLLVAPLITSQPQPTVDVCLGESISLSVVASGSGPISYQWRKDGSPIVNQTTANLSIAVSTASDAGEYDCVISDSTGRVNSDVSIVTVTSLSVTINSSTGNFILCEGEEIDLIASGALNYNWGNGFSNQATLPFSEK